jgi:predicted DsbA family dithiol-disulfide isomerase
MAVRVEVFADVACPFAHVSLRRLRALRAEHHATTELVVHAWPLELVNGHPLDPEHVAREIDDLRRQIVPDLFTSFRKESFPRSSMLAFGLAARAYERDVRVGEQVSVALRDALFEDGRPIDDPSVLASIAAGHELEPPDAEWSAAVARRSLEDGRARGVQGSPHFFVGETSEFCPALRITARDDGHLDIARDEGRLRSFLDRALG